MADAEQLCRICKHSKPLTSFRHQRFQHWITSSCLDCCTGSQCATLTQPPSQLPTTTLPPLSQDPITTSSRPSQDLPASSAAALPVAGQPHLAPTTTVPPATPTGLPTVSTSAPTPPAPGQHFVTRADLFASIGELHQFLQDEIAYVLHKVANPLTPLQPSTAATIPPAQVLPAPPTRIAQPAPALPAQIGEYQSVITYPWLSGDLIDKIHQDTLSIYKLPKLANLRGLVLLLRRNLLQSLSKGSLSSKARLPLRPTASSSKRCPISQPSADSGLSI